MKRDIIYKIELSIYLIYTNKTAVTKKLFLDLIFPSVLLLTATFLYLNHNLSVWAKVTEEPDINKNIKLPTDTFSMSGTISGLIYTDSSYNVNMTPPDILFGYWNLNIEKGKVNNFTANFTVISINAFPRYHVTITNFRSLDDTAKQLTSNGSISNINGYSDIKINNNYEKKEANINIVIYRLSTIAILLPPISIEDKSNDLFRAKPIYGIIHSFIDEKGEKYFTGLP